VTDIQSIILQLERQKAAIENAIAALSGLEGQPAVPGKGPGRPKKIVATKPAEVTSGRQRQIEAMRQYWAKKKAAGKKAAPRKAPRKGGITAEGRKRLSEMMRKRWAAKRAG
jgi:sugar-specific transcriptional regulator TrmB